MALTDFGIRPNFERSLACFFFRVWQFGTLRTGHTASTQIGNHTVETRERERERATKKAYDACKKDPLLKPEDDSLMITNERSNNMSVKQTVASDHKQH